MRCRLFLCRHGETTWNREFRLQGYRDIPLSDRGLYQVQALGQRLSSLRIDAVYSSDLSRAVETARAIAGHRAIPVVEMTSLREMDYGSWEGLAVGEIRSRYNDAYRAWWEDPVGATIPGGESLGTFNSRVLAGFREIVEAHPDQQVVVACHGGPIRCLVASALRLDLRLFRRIRQDNAALNIVDFTGPDEGTLVLLNDCSHLADRNIPL